MLPSAIIFVVDGLGAGFLGPYGNTWVETQSCNRLASEGLLCEFALSDSLSLETVYRSYWTGRHAMDSRPAAGESLIQRSATEGVKTILLTDEPQVAALRLAEGFTEKIVLPAGDVATAAGEIEETQIARLAQAAMQQLALQHEPFLLWIHSRGMSAPWDAPRDYRNAFRDEDDPEAGDFTAPPHLKKSTGFDPDELLGYVHAYAGQVTVMDLCLGALLDAAGEHPLAKSTLFALTSPRGFPLGEHGQIGPVDSALYGEALNIPLLLRLPEHRGALMRTQELVQPADLHDLLLAQFSPGTHSLLLDIAEGRDHVAREIACAVSDGERAIRTPAWFLKQVQRNVAETRVELYAKSDDRWEVNEVSRRAADVAEELQGMLRAFEQAASAGKHGEVAPLAEALSNQWR